MISILTDWQILTDELIADARTLQELRNPSVHYGRVENREKDSFRAVRACYSLVDGLWGMKSDNFFFACGELYIKRNCQDRPLVQKMILPYCHLLGCKHRVEGTTIIDDAVYDAGSLTDEEFRSRRVSGEGEIERDSIPVRSSRRGSRVHALSPIGGRAMMSWLTA